MGRKCRACRYCWMCPRGIHSFGVASCFLQWSLAQLQVNTRTYRTCITSARIYLSIQLFFSFPLDFSARIQQISAKKLCKVCLLKQWQMEWNLPASQFCLINGNNILMRFSGKRSSGASFLKDLWIDLLVLARPASAFWVSFKKLWVVLRVL